MAALVTLASTRLMRGVNATARQIKVESATGITAGTRLWMDRELMSAVSLGVTDNLGTWVNVQRGVDGTSSSSHSQNIPILSGPASSFFTSDPQGRPTEAILATPYVNVITGDMWVSQGSIAEGNQVRWWVKQVDTHGVGPLGVPTNVRAASTVTQN